MKAALNNINVYIDSNDESIIKTISILRRYKHRNITLWIPKSLSKEWPFVMWKDKHYIEDGVNNIRHNLYKWDINSKLVSIIDDYQITCIDCHIVNEHMKFAIITSRSYAKDTLIYFEDSPDNLELPKEFCKIKVFNEYRPFKVFCQDNNIIAKFALDLENNFVKLRGANNVKGATVYRHTETGFLWYLDTFHQNHYEVFDPTGKHHIGEADMEGNIDRSKADKRKRPIL